ncbi:MAG: 2'-5' RNA ligase family protein [Actinobacteria bacterium]|nr:2'-5' RNA ligase family protein [Actinomycetota bacterium]
MTALPTQMIDRWQRRAEPAPGHGILYWHVLLGDQPEVTDLARQAQQRLAHFSGLHMTPLQWLHITTLVAGASDDLTGQDIEAMTAAASQALSAVQPVTVRLGEIWYHPEAIMLGVRPADTLKPLHEAAREATQKIMGASGLVDNRAVWRPHATICYSTADQPAGPIIEALGRQLPGCEARVSTLSLVIQRGAEREWDWQRVAAIHLDDSGRFGRSISP